MSVLILRTGLCPVAGAFHALASRGNYGPVYLEVGFHEKGGYFDAGFKAGGTPQSLPVTVTMAPDSLTAVGHHIHQPDFCNPTGGLRTRNGHQVRYQNNNHACPRTGNTDLLKKRSLP